MNSIHAYLDQQKKQLTKLCQSELQMLRIHFFEPQLEVTQRPILSSSYHFWIIRKEAVNLQVSEPIEISAGTKHSWLKLKYKPCMEKNS